MVSVIKISFRLQLVVLLCFLFGNILTQSNDTSQLLEKERNEIIAHLIENPKESLMKLERIQTRALKIKDVHFANRCDAIKALLYYNIGNYQKTLAYGNKAIKEAKKNKFTDIQAIATGIIAMQYSKVGLKEEAVKTGMEAVKLAESNNDLSHMDAQYNVNLYYSAILNRCDAKKYALEALNVDEKNLQIAQKLQNKKYIRSALLNLILSYNENGKYEEAKKINKQLLRDYEGESDLIDMYLYDRAGITYFNAKQSDSAIYYLNKGLSLAKKLDMPEDKMNFLEQLKEAYKENKNPEKAKSISSEYDNISMQQASNKTDALQISVKNIVNENQESEKNKTSLFKKITFGSSIIVIFLLCLYYIYYIRFRKQKLSVEAQQKIIKEKQEKISQLKSQLEDNALNEIIQYAVEDNPIFLKRYKEVYPDFFKKLNALSAELTIDDLKCCAMLHLNFSTKEIASYTHTSIRTIENRKFRIRKKLHLENSQKDLGEFLTNL